METNQFNPNQTYMLTGSKYRTMDQKELNG